MTTTTPHPAVNGRCSDHTEATKWAAAVLARNGEPHPTKAHRVEHVVEPWDLPSMLCALEDHGPSQRTGVDDNDNLSQPVTTLVHTAAGNDRVVADIGTRHGFDHPEGGAIAWVDDTSDPTVLKVAAVDRGHAVQTRDALVERAATRSSTWRGQAIVVDTASDVGWRHVDPGDPPGPPEHLGRCLHRNLVLPLTDAALRHDVPRRGVVVQGAPGTGKTSALMWTARQVLGSATVLFAGPTTVGNPAGLRHTIAMAAAAAPSLLIMEDLDLAVGQRTLNPVGTGEFIDALDNLHRTPGVYIAATTCCTSLIDPALTNRPGRFDVTCDAGLIPDSYRRHLIVGIATDLGVADTTNINALVGATDGWSLAEIADLGPIARLASAATGSAPDLAAAVTESNHDFPDGPARGVHQTVHAGYL